MSSFKALRDAARFVGKEDTVPLRLLYSRHNHRQVAQDELSTRVEASSGSTQVHVCREECLHGGCVCWKDAFRRHFSLFVYITASPLWHIFVRREIHILLMNSKTKT